MPTLNKQMVRNQFANRLRELRVPRGFTTARSLARALEIDENRYTRYERAEVEPDLFMIRKICQILSVTPCDLLNPAEKRRKSNSGRRIPRPGDAYHDGRDHAAQDDEVVPREFGVATHAWEVAEATVRLRQTGRKGHDHDSHDGTAASPLAEIGEAGALYKSLMREPFETISSLSQDPALLNADQQPAQDLRASIERFVQELRASRGL